MPLPPHPIIVNGGCNCRAIRYKIDIPGLENRPIHPSSDALSTVHLPFIVADHCNDCRRATGSFLPLWICTPEDMITASLTFRSRSTLDPDASKRDEQNVQEPRGPWIPASVAFKPGPESSDSFLTFYESSEGRRRSFCGRCGTNLAYSMFPMLEGWPEMLDMVLGTADRNDLDGDALAPERHLWWDSGIDWVQKLSTEGVGTLPKHPIYKINEVVDG